MFDEKNIPQKGCMHASKRKSGIPFDASSYISLYFLILMKNIPQKGCFLEKTRVKRDAHIKRDVLYVKFSNFYHNF